MNKETRLAGDRHIDGCGGSSGSSQGAGRPSGAHAAHGAARQAGKPKADQSIPRLRPFVFHTLRLLLGVVFLYASYDKILHPQAFAQAVYNYQILPAAAVNLVALALPWLELLLGLCLVTGFWLPGATAISIGLLAVFMGTLVFNQIRGLDIHCGCFSTQSADGPADLWAVVRDLSFLALSVYLAVCVFFYRSAPEVPSIVTDKPVS